MNKNNKLIINNITLDNGNKIKSLDLSGDINLFYARNGICKTLLFNYLKENLNIHTLDQVVSYSYINEIKKNNFNYEKYISKINEYNDIGNLISSDIMKDELFSYILDKIDFLCYGNLSGYKEEHPEQNDDHFSSIEKILIDFDYFSSLKYSNNILNFKNMYKFINEYYNTYWILREQSIGNIKIIYDFIVDQENEYKVFLNDSNKDKEYIDRIISSIKHLNFNSEIVDEDIEYYSEKKEKINNNIINKENKFIEEFSYEVQQTIANIANPLHPFLKCVDFGVDVSIFQKTKIFLRFIYLIFYIKQFEIVMPNFIEKLESINKDELFKEFEKMIEIYKLKKKTSNIYNIENKFNSYFFKYIKFYNARIIDYLFINKCKPNIFLYVRNKRIVDFNNLSDGEINAIILISLYLEINSNNNKKILLLDDAMISFDKTNSLGLINLLNDVIQTNNIKLILLSHDSYLINLAESFFPNVTKNIRLRQTFWRKMIIQLL